MELGLNLFGYTQMNGVHPISPPQRFEGGEEAYDEHISDTHRANVLRSCRGARHLKSAGLSAPSTVFATLAGEDLALPPAQTLDAIAIASPLHHIAAWRGFPRDAAVRLRAGGVLVIQGPCQEGNLMMGMALDIVLSPPWPRDLLEPTDLESITRCRDSICLLADTTAVKQGEDKHTFLITELIASADAAGSRRSRYYTNGHVHELAGTDLFNAGHCSFTAYLDGFVKQHRLVGPAGMRSLREFVFPLLLRLDARFRAGDGVALFVCVVFRR